MFHISSSSYIIFIIYIVDDTFKKKLCNFNSLLFWAPVHCEVSVKMYLFIYVLDDNPFGILYLALVWPILEYGSTMWHSLNKALPNCFESCQRFACRVIIQSWKASYEDLLLKVNLPPLYKHRTSPPIVIYSIFLCIVLWEKYFAMSRLKSYNANIILWQPLYCICVCEGSEIHTIFAVPALKVSA